MSEIGLALLVLAAGLAAAEAHVVSYGALGTLALATLAAGIGLIVAGAGSGLEVALGVAVAVALVGGAFGWMALRRLIALRRAPVRGGPAGLIGRRGEVRVPPQPVGRVFMDGALWRARAWPLEDDAALRPGDPVVVEGVDGLTLTVRRADEWEVAP